MAVYPANDSTLVNQIGEILGADLDVVMSLNNLDEDSNKKHPFPCPTTYRTALTYYLDITNPPRTNVLYELAQYASEPSEQEHLHKMASSSGEGKVSLRTPMSLHLAHTHTHPTPRLPIPSFHVSSGALPELGGGGPQAHPSHSPRLPVTAAAHRPPV